MAEVMDMPLESLDRRRERQPDRRDRTDEESPPPPPRRRDRDSRERRDERDERLPNRRAEYHDRARSPGPVGSSRDRERDYKRRLSPSPPPYPHRDRRHSPPRRSPPPPFKRSRRDDGGYENRRGSPRFGYDYGGYDRGALGGRPGFADERPHGRYMNRSSGGYQDGSGRCRWSVAYMRRPATYARPSVPCFVTCTMKPMQKQSPDYSKERGLKKTSTASNMM